MKYGYTRMFFGSFEDAVTKIRDELAEEGFGILTEIDVKATLKKKLDVDFNNYIILGACNPHLAHKALEAEREIGLLLPCNVIVYEKDNNVFVSVMIPSVVMSMVDNLSLSEVAIIAEKKLKKVLDSM